MSPDCEELGTHLSPDCRDGNHQKCDRLAWCVVDDDFADCECDCDHG